MLEWRRTGFASGVEHTIDIKLTAERSVESWAELNWGSQLDSWAGGCESSEGEDEELHFRWSW